MTTPTMPCREIRTPEHGKIYLDRDGLAWTVDSRRLPEYDASGPEPTRRDVNADLAHRFAALYWSAVALQDGGDEAACAEAEARCDAIEACAQAAGCEREFKALITGGAT